MIQGEVRTTVFFFIAITLLLLSLRPDLLLASNGDLLQFGLGGSGQGESIIAAPVLSIFLPMVLYLIVKKNNLRLF